MDRVNVLLESLPMPWSAKTRGVLAGLADAPGVCWDDLSILAGFFVEAHADGIDLELGRFVANEGFIFDATFHAKIAIPGASERALSFQSGEVILCCGRLQQLSTTCWRADANVTLMKRPVFDIKAEWDFLHLFAGAFHGWSQAFNMLPKLVESFHVGAQVSLDADLEVAQIWMEKHKLPCHVGPLRPRQAFEAHANAFIQTDVGDYTVFHLMAPHANLCYTASPPCQSWSKAGLSAGIACSNGWAFVDTIKLTVAGQPHMLTVECVDEISAHPHFAVLEAMFTKGGYRCIWQHIVPYHQLSHVSRTRWLSVWVRFDIVVECLGPSLPVRADRIIPWSSQHYRYVLPRLLREQLTLTQSELQVYGDARFLPMAKQNQTLQSASQTQVLRKRIQDPYETLPTLCASYGNQHNLSPAHLQARGIFAVLDFDGKDFFFIDPFVHCSLLGATESIAVSFKMVLAFRQIGNAISVPHAILTLGVGFRAILSWDLPVHALVLKCWDARLTSFSSFVVHNDRFAFLCSIDAFIREFAIKEVRLAPKTEYVEWCLMHCRSEATKTIFLPSDWKVNQVSEIFVWRFDVRGHIFCRNEDHRNLHSLCLRDFAIIVQHCQICVDGRPFLEVTMRPCEPTAKSSSQGGEIIEISPTLQSSRPMPAPGIASNSCPLDFDAITSTEAFRSVLRSTEQCLRDDRGVPALFAFCTPAMAFTGLVSDEALSDPTVDLLAPVSKRLRLSVSSSEVLGSCAFFLPAQPCVDNEPWFAFIRASGAMGVAALQQQPIDSCFVHLGETMFKIEHCNGLPWTGRDRIKHGDVLVLSFQGPVRAGGHHASGPHALAPGATFEDRCEFAVNTSGWIASDELTFWIQHVQWANPGYAYFAMPVLWDDDNGDFDFGTQVEFAIPNNRLTVIPILLRSHWCAVEVNRASHLVTVVVLGFPGPYFHTVVAAVARLLDFHPSRLAASSTPLPDYPHMCGWILLDRWIRAAGLQDELPPFNDGFEQVSFGKKALIEDALVSAIEDWVADNIPTDVWLQPVKLRRAFFSQLARNSMQHDSVTAIRLFVNFVDAQAPSAAPQHPGGFPLRPHPAIPDYHIIRRLLKMRDQPGWLASDESDWILEYPRLVLPQTYFCPPARWCSVTSAFLYFQGLNPDFRHHTSVTWFLIVDGTWVQLDLSVGDAWSTVGLTGLKTLFCYGPPEIFGYVPAFIAHIANLIGLPAREIQAVPVPFQTPPGMCGWSLLHGFFQRMQLVMPDTPHAFLDILANTRHRELVRVIKGTDFACWENSGVAADTVDFAYDARNGFLCRILEGRTTEAFECAGGVDDGSSKPDSPASAAMAAKANTAQDPWASGDPWAKKPKRLFSTKWEDLLLPDKHPVLDAKGNMLDQTHKLQMSARKAGAVLATKASIADLVRTGPTAPSVVILPNADKATFGEHATKLLGPFELVLKDPALGSEYKRLVLLLPLQGSITYSLPKPSVSLTATEVTEIVAEIDARLLSLQEIENVKAGPMDYIRGIVGALHPTLKDSLAFYALRVGRHPTAEKHEPQWQCIIKAPLRQRQALLSSSGMQMVLLRDYLDKQHCHEDLSVVPKFWPPTARDLSEIRIVTQNTAGFAGVALTRRGLAVRAWNDNIAAIRQAVLPMDPRLTKRI